MPRTGVLYLSGEFDMGSVATFAEETAATLDGQDPVVLDLSDVTFLDSSGLNAILPNLGTAQSESPTCLIASPPDPVLEPQKWVLRVPNEPERTHNRSHGRETASASNAPG